MKQTKRLEERLHDLARICCPDRDRHLYDY